MSHHTETDDPKLSQTILLEDEFVETCLPLTMELADNNREIIEPRLPFINCKWPFHDKVLVWLFKTFREDVVKYHAQRGPMMVNIINRDALEHVDEAAFARLRVRIRAFKGAISRTKKTRKPLSLDSLKGFTVLRRRSKP